MDRMRSRHGTEMRGGMTRGTLPGHTSVDNDQRICSGRRLTSLVRGLELFRLSELVEWEAREADHLPEGDAQHENVAARVHRLSTRYDRFGCAPAPRDLRYLDRVLWQ